MANPLDIHLALARQLFGTPKVRAEDRRRAARGALRQAQAALADGNTAEAITLLEHATDRLRRSLELEPQVSTPNPNHEAPKETT